MRDLKSLWPVPLVILGVAIAVLFPMWKRAVETNTDARADPHHIAGPLYFVGAPDVASFLLTGPDGHLLIATGYENTAHKITDSVEQLGFRTKDIKAVLATGAQIHAAGALAGLQQATGAPLWIAEGDAGSVGQGRSDASEGDFGDRFASFVGASGYPPARIDHRVKDGDVIRVGPIAVTAHIVPGCTAWTFAVNDASVTPARTLQVVHACDLPIAPKGVLADPERSPAIRSAFERRLNMLRALPVDIWLAPQGRTYGRFKKYDASLHSENKVAPFIDREGYFKWLDDVETKYREVLAAART